MASPMDAATEEKIAQNNDAFRRSNEEIRLAAHEHGLDDSQVVPFICECSDARCVQIIKLTVAEYRRVRNNSRWFVHAVGHEPDIPGAVRLIEQHERYTLVEKIGHAGTLAEDLASPKTSE
jgi:hypothetical protein